MKKDSTSQSHFSTHLLAPFEIISEENTFHLIYLLFSNRRRNQKLQCLRSISSDEAEIEPFITFMIFVEIQGRNAFEALLQVRSTVWKRAPFAGASAAGCLQTKKWAPGTATAFAPSATHRWSLGSASESPPTPEENY
ncbi:hypothetical protein CEXT_555801 [Caerostris extrusa]|uniref:Uncharacterized protein n=1 Tax=Caerostris extrusa TaxID=172846 RepID=A0AAV4XIP6_CAEEX|nr:hypothetical protein CEXT_555801 [Caerostris extrusa]